VPKLRRWKQLEKKHLFPQKLTKQERENWNLLAETWKFESKNQNVKVGIYQLKLEKLKPESRSVKVGVYQQKLEKLKPEKQKLESWNLSTEIWKAEAWKVETWKAKVL
jgi:hypothetical protein